MAESQDRDSKTEEPTEKRIADAVEKGDVPVSKEAAVLATLAGTTLYLSLVLPGLAPALAEALTDAFSAAALRPLGNGADTVAALKAILVPVAVAIGPLFAILAVAGIAASVAQNPPRIVGERVRPKRDRVSPVAGWRRLFGRHGLMEFGITLLKVVTVASVTAAQLATDHDRIVRTMRTDPGELPELILVISVRLLGVVTAVTVVIMAIDLIRSRMAWRSNLMMSRQDLKDEFKQAEGDPILKARQRSLARDRSRRRMMDQVPRATVVITNPTHYAVALRYLQEEGGAPLVLAKGQDLIALKIRSIAEANGIPIVENVALARSLHKGTEIDQMIPPAFYRAVAEVIYHVHCRNGA
ncbi:EscU/YscU/HrcU family type III secretion system export apparatus switch protein [Mongoliimonas terrestris]|uniref:EscU/YscU/HrcU family type III secretion system export apparatus switch protein n=1 Tax=Mongoliimonas terrestris TaxID=1709001 RepID=UPI000949A711|nr:EscU/YscU/HrcU family type III secretion system export apparatus switch protein [Mongoliimonas terrestris]